MAEWTLLDHHLRSTSPELHAALIQESRHDTVIEDMVLGHERAAFSEGLANRWRQMRPVSSRNRKLGTSRRLANSLDQPQHWSRCWLLVVFGPRVPQKRGLHYLRRVPTKV